MKIKKLIQPDDFDHLTEWWLIEREKKGNFTALRILEKQYPQYARRLSLWVMEFLEVEAIVNDPMTEEELADYAPMPDEVVDRLCKEAIERLRAEGRFGGKR